jgi:O-Antigen ligase
VAYTSFSAGGYFAGTTAVAAVVVAVVLVLRLTLAERPFAGLSGPVAVAAGALAAFALWTLASAGWSHAPARAMLEFDRVLLYLLVLVLCGSFERTSENVRWLVRGLAAGAVLVCAAALASRLLPDIINTSPGVMNERLGWPLTYWNSLGLLAVLGGMLCLGLTCDEREPAVGRVLAAAGLPLASAALMLTFSRGGFAVGFIGLVTFCIFARPRAVLTGLPSVLPAMLVAAGQAYRSDELQRADPFGPAAVAEGHSLAIVVVACVIAAAVLRAATLPVDRRLVAMRPHPRLQLALRTCAAVLVVATAAVAIGPLDAPARAERQYQRFLDGTVVQDRGEIRDRLGDPGNNGRLKAWRVSMDAYHAQPFHGHGAGTWQHLWTEHRTTPFTMTDGHSLYVEVLAELGWVGLVLVVAAILAILVALAARVRGADRTLQAGLLAAGLAWVAHAGFDWDWEMPAVTLGFFAIGGLALASWTPSKRTPGRTLRVIGAIGLLVVAVTPARVAVSQAHLRDSVDAFKRHDCTSAIDSAIGSSSALGARPEPFEILAYCDARLGRSELGERMMRAAIRRDPESWELWYGLAVVRASGGRDPRPAARHALRLDRQGHMTTELVALFRTDKPRKWRRRALSARLPVR